MILNKKRTGCRRAALAVPITLALFTLLFIVYIAFLFIPAVDAVRSANGITVHCELLGEYPSDIEHIAIVEAKSGRTIWHLRARGEKFQLHKFDLVAGRNEGKLQPFWGDFQTVLPAQGAFELQRGIQYRVSICFADWSNLCRGTEFTF